MIDARLATRCGTPRDATKFQLDVHLVADAGVTVLYGPSGAGKTLTLHCVAGFIRPDAGRVLVNDQLYFDAGTGVCVPPHQRRCAYIFQDHALFPHLTLGGNMRLAASATRLGPLERRKRIQELLDAFELTDLVRRRPVEMSGGQRQRAVIARALVSDPALILFDEPTRGLDVRLRAAFYDNVRALLRRSSAPIVVVTHDLDECAEIGDRMYVMGDGRFLQQGLVRDVLAAPQNVEVARLLGNFNLASAEIVSLDPGRNTGELRVFDQVIAAPYLPGHLIGDRGWLCVARQQVRALPPGVRSLHPSFVVQIERFAPTVGGVRLMVDESFAVDAPASQEGELRRESAVQVEVPVTAMRFLTR